LLCGGAGERGEDGEENWQARDLAVDHCDWVSAYDALAVKAAANIVAKRGVTRKSRCKVARWELTASQTQAEFDLFENRRTEKKTENLETFRVVERFSDVSGGVLVLFGRAAGIANDELSVEERGRGRGGAAFDVIDEDARGGHANFARRLADHSEPRAEEGGPIKIIEAEKADFFRARKANFLNGSEGAHGHHVVGTKNGGRSLAVGEQLHGVEVAAFHVIVAGVNHRAVRADFGSAKGAEKALKSFEGGAARSIASNDANVAMAETEKVASGALGGAVVVNSNATYIRIVLQRVTVGVNDRKVSEEHVAFGRFAIDGWNANDTVDAAAVERIEIIALLFATFAGVADEHSVIGGGGIVLRAADELDIKIVGEVGNHDGDGVSLLKAQTASQIVGAVTKRFDSFVNAAAHPGADVI
jgi:hypothetical protein